MRGGERARERERVGGREAKKESKSKRGHTLCCNMAKNGLGERETERGRKIIHRLKCV